jgi:hypothetical protein
MLFGTTSSKAAAETFAYCIPKTSWQQEMVTTRGFNSRFTHLNIGT